MTEGYKIRMTRRKIALVSAQDWVELSRYKWCAAWNPSAKGFYAKRKYTRGNGSVTVYMHRQIMGSPVGLQIDHINGDTLDNRRVNLRLATSSENRRNSKVGSRNKSGFKGVSQKKQTGRWQANIRASGAQIHLGYFATPEEAHAAYCVAAKKYHGEFARVV